MTGASCVASGVRSSDLARLAVPHVLLDHPDLGGGHLADAAGVEVHVWTVNEEADMHRLLDWGVDGILTDFPDRLARVLHERVGRPLPPALKS